MILSSFPGGAEALLAVRAGESAALEADPFAAAVVEHLDDPVSAILMLGFGECLRFTPNPLRAFIAAAPKEQAIAELRAMMEDRELLVPYRALGVGYREEDDRPIGTIVFEYDAPELAESDLPARCTLAENAVSEHYDAPISESYFTVLRCTTQDSAILLKVAPVDGQPNRLFRMVFYLDAPFAGCSN